MIKHAAAGHHWLKDRYSMRRQRTVIAVAAFLLCAPPVAAVSTAQAQAARTSGPVTHLTAWRQGIEVPGTGALNKGGDAGVSSVACATTRDCAVGGSYADNSGHPQGFVASESHGTWHAAIEIPGTARLNEGGNARVDSISCATVGNCTIGGSYADRSGHGQAFVADERNGTWNPAIEVPGTSTLNKGGNAEIFSVSCATASNCIAGGWYMDGSGRHEAFVASEWNGTWRTAIEVPGTSILNKDGGAMVESVSCATAGNCGTGGFYVDGKGNQQAFVATETNGTWHSATQVPGTSALNKGGDAEVNSIACATADNCGTGGFYVDGKGNQQAFVATETNGTWHSATQVPGTSALNKGGDAEVNSITCATPKNCTVAGGYKDRSGHDQAFVASKE
jgi:hypothetical protein